MGKNNCVASKRRVFSYLGDKKIVDKVFNILAKKDIKKEMVDILEYLNLVLDMEIQHQQLL